MIADSVIRVETMAGAVWDMPDKSVRDWRYDKKTSIVTLMARLEHYERVLRLIYAMSTIGVDTPDSDARMALRLIVGEAHDGLYEWASDEI